MTEQTSALLTALRLSTAEPAELLASLDGEPDADADADAEAAWAVEIERRARRVLAEESQGRRWGEVRDELRRQLS